MIERQGALRAWIGRTAVAEDVVTPRLEVSFRATLGAHLVGSPEGAYPLGLHWCLAPVIAEAACLGQDGHPSNSDFLPPVPLPRRMWAGSDVQILAPLRTGARVRRRSIIEGITWKQGRTGSLCFFEIRHDIENANGPVISELQTLVHRDATSAGQGTNSIVPEPALMASVQAHSVPIDEVVLFRYSALTFNSHRIHYDAPYARDVEGYEGVVIHGPLQATLLLSHAARLFGRSPSRITIRSVSAAVGAQTLMLVGTPAKGNALDLRIRSCAGVTTMRGSARCL